MEQPGFRRTPPSWWRTSTPATSSPRNGAAATCHADRIVIAGDLRHSTRDVDEHERQELAAIQATVAGRVSLELVRGNHDAPVVGVDVSMHAWVMVGEVQVVHEPPATSPERWTICGHLHPRITLRDETGAGARYPCALIGDRIIVLPAFSTWAGGVEARALVRTLPRTLWRAFPMHDGAIADLGLAFEPDGNTSDASS
jgi:metallophosphoesterase superfamily enzyme